MNKCVVLYESWQYECCGEDFKVGSKIEWLVMKGEKINLPIKTDNIDYYYEAHSTDYKNIFVLEGTIKEIKTLYLKYEPSKDNPKLLVPTNGFLSNVNTSKNVANKLDNMDFSSYLVYIENYSIREALESEVTFR